jgi:hypothetical protein
MKKLIICFLGLCISAPLVAVQITDFSMADAVLREKKAGVEIWSTSDGTVITVFGDRSEAVLPDKSRIVKYTNGRREVFAADGTKTVIVDEAKGERTYGIAKKTITFEGRTPFGEVIEQVEKKVLKNPVLIRLIYLPAKSDEVLYVGQSEGKVEMEIQVFFDTLYDSLRQKYINDSNEKKALPDKPFDILVSYCRYCKTGYCFGKERMVVVEIAENGGTVKTFTSSGLELRNRDVVKSFVRQIVESVSK